MLEIGATTLTMTYCRIKSSNENFFVSHPKIMKFTCRKNKIMLVDIVLIIKQVTFSCETFAFKYNFTQMIIG